MRKNPRRILSPQRLPFRHPGTVEMAGISIRNLREFDHLESAIGGKVSDRRNVADVRPSARIMLLLKEILPEPSQRHMLLAL